MTDAELSERFAELIAIANEKYDGHVTIMKFTTNWRIIFGTADDRDDIAAATPGKTFAEAAEKVIANPVSVYDRLT